ncbi:hypothetical protein RDWZM_005066 [Blomia tropicalis]|uniref:Uncharacterized protein n=1 Tax=Blomia tropicalis TaxID=40697 RepID=A0A9Q0M5J8_BLOTA|nr:hypothetical protein RDWZM_005066 [Blomia tropicalis]
MSEIKCSTKSIYSGSKIQSRPTSLNQTSWSSFVHDYVVHPFLSQMSTTSTFLDRSQQHILPQSNTGSYPPTTSSGNPTNDRLYEFLYRSTKNMFGAAGVTFDCERYQQLNQNRPNRTPIDEKPNYLFDRRKSIVKTRSLDMKNNYTPDADMGDFYLNENIGSDNNQIKDLIFDLKFEDLFDQVEMKRSDCKRSRSMSDMELSSIMKNESQFVVGVDSKIFNPYRYRSQSMINDNNDLSDSCGEYDSDDVYVEKFSMQPNQLKSQSSCSPDTSNCSNFELLLNLFHGCEPTEICKVSDKATTSMGKFDVYPDLPKSNCEERKDVIILQKDRQRKQERKRKNRRRRTRKSKLNKLSDSDSSSSRSTDGEEEMTEIIDHLSRKFLPESKKSNACSNKKNVTSVYYYQSYDDDDLGSIFSFDDHMCLSDEKSDSENSCTVNDTHHLDNLDLKIFGGGGLLANNLFGCENICSLSMVPTTTRKAIDQFNIDSSQQDSYSITSSVDDPYPNESLVPQTFENISDESKHSTDSFSWPIKIPEISTGTQIIFGVSPDFSPIPLSEDDIRRNREMMETEEKTRFAVEEANRRWNDHNLIECFHQINDEIFNMDEDQIDNRQYSSHPVITKHSTNHSKKPNQKCQFSSQPPTIFWIDETDEEIAASRECRSNYWEMVRLDRLRLMNLMEKTITPILSAEHRERVFRDRFM